jgi:hypothetical protein
LHALELIFAHHQNIFFCCAGNVQQVTDYNHQDNKKPHWKHNHFVSVENPNSVPVMNEPEKILDVQRKKKWLCPCVENN